jgi:hypothetical protein
VSTFQTMLSPSALAQLRDLLAAPAPLLLVLETPLIGVGAQAAAELSRAWVSASAFERDVHLVEPAGERWSVPELDAEVVARSRVSPYERLVVVLDRADTMAHAAADRLLTTLEEPDVAATFVLVVTHASDLLPTLRGRASAVVTLDPAPASQRVGALLSLGVNPTSAQEAVELAGAQVTLAPLLASDPELMEHARLAFSRPPQGTPAGEAAAKAHASLEALAKAASAAAGAKGASAQKAALRVLLRELMSRRREHVARMVRTCDAATFRELRAELEALERAQLQLGTYASPLLVLTSLLSP